MNKKGSLYIETAIIFPFFLLAILAITLLIKVAGTEEISMGCFAAEGQRFAKEMYLTQLESLPENYGAVEGFHEAVLELRTLEKVSKEKTVDLKNLRVIRNYSFLDVDEGEQDPGIVDYSLHYKVEIPLPLTFGRCTEFEQTIMFRGFIGAEQKGEGMGFDTMERPDDPFSVYVFPRAGEKFHIYECRMIDIYPVEKILSLDLKRKYAPCRLCDADSLPWGCRVYCFESSGKVYHKGSCTAVDRYVVEMDRDEALRKGYTPCSFCGGYND